MNIGETSAILPGPEAVAVAGAAAPAVGAGAAGFADRLAEAMGESPASAAGKPGTVRGDVDAAVAGAPVAGGAVGGVVVPVADMLAVQAVLSGGAAVADVQTSVQSEAGVDVAVPAGADGVDTADIEPRDGPVVAAGAQAVSAGAATFGGDAEATVVRDEDGEADVPLPVAALTVPVPAPAPVAVWAAATADVANAGKSEGPSPEAAAAGPDAASPAVKPLRQSGRALVGAAPVAMTVAVVGPVEPGIAPTVTEKRAGPVTGNEIPAEKAGAGDGAGDEAPVSGEAKPAKPKALASVTAAEPAVARAVVDAVAGGAVAGAAPAAPKAVLSEPKPADPGAPVVQQMPLPVAQGADRTGAQPVRTDLPGWELVLSERISAELSDDGQEIELSLSPEKLGPLRIKLEMVDGLAQVKFITATPEAARVFTEAQHRLTEGLSRAGIDLGSQSAESGKQGSQPDDRATPRNRMTEFLTHSRRIEAGDAPGLRRAAAGLVNLMA